MWFPAVGIPILTGILIMVVQWERPFKEDWRVSREEVQVDLVHLVVNGLILPPIARGLFFGGVALLATWLSVPHILEIWPNEWPLWIQLLLALVLGDFMFYAVHRWILHETEWGWRIHSVHHSSEKLYFFSATRLHPINFAATYLGPLAPLILLGAHDEVVILFSVYTAINGGLQHANIQMNTAWLNKWLATADYHRWHHSQVVEESNTNYSSNLILWDWVFGTRFLPERTIEHVGLGETQIPQNAWEHLIAPFAWQRYQPNNETEHSV